MFDTVIQIFCKAPVPGTVKTRLMTVLNAEQASDVHKQLSRATFDLVASADLAAMQIWCSPDIEHRFFTQATQDFDCTLHQQVGTHLGERMHYAFCEGLKAYQHVVLIGCDCPSLTAHDLQEAVIALKTLAGVVLGPAEDGGYVLIGLNQAEKQLFEGIQWGQSNVLQLTRERIDRLAIKAHELKEQWDVDYPEDLERLNNMGTSLSTAWY